MHSVNKQNKTTANTVVIIVGLGPEELRRERCPIVPSSPGWAVRSAATAVASQATSHGAKFKQIDWSEGVVSPSGLGNA
jgi:hypothetical protein